MRKQWKRAIGVAMSLSMLATMSLSVFASEPEGTESETGTTDTPVAEATTWTLGYGDENQNAPIAGEQGTNGWHFMYTDETNVDGVFDVNRITDCTYYGTEGHGMGAWGLASWLPDEEALKSYNDSGNNYWYLDASATGGELSPNVLGGAPFSAVIAWEAPVEGTYNVKVDYYDVGGKPGFHDAAGFEDKEGGVTFSVNTKEGCLEKIDAPAVDDQGDLKSGTIEKEVQLQAGDKVYVVADPETEGDQDIAKTKIKIDKVIATTAWELGYEENENGPGVGVQNENGWSFLYSDETDAKGYLDVSQMKECVYGNKGSIWCDYGPMNWGGPADGYMWLPDAYAAEDYNAYDNDNWWWFEEDGHMVTNVNVNPVTAAIAWEAPEDGNYQVDVAYKAGGDTVKDGDTVYYYNESYVYPDGSVGHEGGVTLSVNTKDGMIESFKAPAGSREHPDLYEGTLTNVVSLKKGERVYVAVDPEDRGNYDAAQVQIKVTNNAEGEPTVPQQKPEEPEQENPVTPTTPKPSVVKVSKISLSGISKKIAAGKSIQLTAKVTPSNATNKAVTWTSSNTKYATVTTKGKVTLKKAGIGKTVKITAKAKDGSGKKATYSIKIMKGAVKKITISGSNSVKAGKTLKLKAKVTTTKGTANKTVKWTSSNTKYATVSSTGKVKASKSAKGKTVTITATATDGSGKKATKKIKIK